MVTFDVVIISIVVVFSCLMMSMCAHDDHIAKVINTTVRIF